jgi:thiol-disulfide isomerase/thioredoxin
MIPDLKEETMAEKSAVTPDRFAQGLTYMEYVERLTANRDQFQRNYQEFQLEEADREFFSEVNRNKGPLKVVALGENWCPDVFRGLPVMARIAEAADMELRVFPRDESRDIMNEYLNQGVYMSIPVFAFYDQEFRPLCHWIERPAAANAWMAGIREELEKIALSEEERREERTRRQQTEWGRWRQETVRELKSLLASV